jgi:hypothetical protein
VLIADTSYELYAACETVTDLDQLYMDLGIEGESTDDVLHRERPSDFYDLSPGAFQIL